MDERLQRQNKMDKYTGEYLDDEVAHIKQSIADILLTAKGSRIMRRTYGSNLYQLIDRPISAALMLQLSTACVMAISQWEPRVRVESFKVSANPTNSAQYQGTLTATIRRTNQKITLTELALNL